LALLVAPAAFLTRAGVLLWATFGAVTVAGALLAGWTRARSRRARAAAGLAASLVVIASLFGLSALARARSRALFEPSRRGELVDVVLNPNPGDPLCWIVILIEDDERAGQYALHRGTVSLAPGWHPASGCASYRFSNPGHDNGGSVAAWDPPVRAALDSLRGRSERDCYLRAWLQFGRAPALGDDEIGDLRFETGRGNFTRMGLRPDPAHRGCPPYMTSWAMPRADLLRESPRAVRASRQP
jgi:inner membrane protein